MIRLKKLSGRQVAFVEAFLTNGANAADAARRAGYSTGDVAGHRLLCRDSILAVILGRVERMGAEGDVVLHRLLARQSPAVSKRVGMLLANLPTTIGPPDRPAVVLNVADADLREHVVNAPEITVRLPVRCSPSGAAPLTPDAKTISDQKAPVSRSGPNENQESNDVR